MSEEFAFQWRVIEPWHEPDGITFFSDHGSILTWADMADPQPSSLLGRWLAQVREWGFNGLALYADPEVNPAASAAFSRFLRSQGIGLIIRRDWNETETGRSWPIGGSNGQPRTSPLLCPYNPAVREYWAGRIARDYAFMPELAGYRMNGTDFYYTDGAPWSCQCESCRRRTGRERTRDAIRLVAELLQPSGGTLFWETCQDDPWGQRHEAAYFHGMTGDIPENARVVIKQYYWDFHPRWPRHPLFDVITIDARGRSPYMTSIQEPGEYQGVHDFAWCLVDEWSEITRAMVATGQDGIWVMAIVDPDGWDHPLNMVNWHAIATLMRRPDADPDAIKLAWAREAFGAQAATVVVDVLDRVTEAARGMYEFDGLWTAAHSRLPTLEYLDSHLCGPLRQLRRMAGMMGMAFPLDMYSPARAEAIRANPQTRMVFNQAPITPALKAEAMAQKDGAVRLMEEAIGLWRGLAGAVPEAAYRRILAGLEGNLNDTRIFRLVMELYFDWKLGRLTEAQIDRALEACRNLRGVVVPDPLAERPRAVWPNAPASFRTFAEQLRRDLREPWVEAHWRANLSGAAVGPLPPVPNDPAGAR